MLCYDYSLRGQLVIPKGHISEWFLFRKVFFISKGHYSIFCLFVCLLAFFFYPEGSLFRNNNPYGLKKKSSE